MSGIFSRTNYDKNITNDKINASKNVGNYSLLIDQSYNNNTCNALNGPRFNAQNRGNIYNCNYENKVVLESELKNIRQFNRNIDENNLDSKNLRLNNLKNSLDSCNNFDDCSMCYPENIKSELNMHIDNSCKCDYQQTNYSRLSQEKKTFSFDRISTDIPLDNYNNWLWTQEQNLCSSNYPYPKGCFIGNTPCDLVSNFRHGCNTSLDAKDKYLFDLDIDPIKREMDNLNKSIM
tara:strand:+ start:1138 stop:1839 length:702 start_codon:yes stop_codon:yes gene_type:complete